MALERPGGGAQNRRPSNYGTSVSRVLRGQEVQQAWPKPQKKRLHPATKERNEFFRQVQWAWKYNYPEFNKQLTEAVARTPLLPRDLFLSMLAGRLLNFYTPDGRMVTSVASQNNVSETLDFLSSEPGSLLVRTEEGWVGLTPGEANQVLTMAGDPLLPSWQAGGGGGGASETLLPPPRPGEIRWTTGINVAANVSFNLTPCYLRSPCTVSKLWCPIRGTPNGIYRPVIYDLCSIEEYPETTLGAPLVAMGPEQSFANSQTLQAIYFDGPVNLPGGRIYAAGLFKRAAAIQTTFAALAYTRMNYFSTTAYTEPPNPCPALSAGTNTALGHWTE